MKLRVARLLSGFTALTVAMIGCTKAPPPLAATKPAEVIVTKPFTKMVVDHEDFTGHTDPVNSVDIRAQVTGYLDKVNFKDGEDVAKGTLLFEIDPRTYAATLEQTRATENQAKAHLDRVTRDYERVSKLAGSPAISREDVDRYASDKLEAAAAYEAAIANRKLAETNLDYTQIRARFDGRISRRNVDPGNIVKANDTILTSLVELDPIYVSFDVDERTVLKIRRLMQKGEILSSRELAERSKASNQELGIEVQIGLADEDDFSLKGMIDFSDNKIDQSTGTLRVRAKLRNPRKPVDPKFPRKNPDFLLSPGLFVRVRLPIGNEKNAILIPEAALASDQGERYVFVVNAENEVVYRRVTTGMQIEGYRVIEKGLELNERVIVRGLQRVRPGAKVNPKTEEEARIAEQKAAEAKKEAAKKLEEQKTSAKTGTTENKSGESAKK